MNLFTIILSIFPLKDPVLIFAIILFIILFTPILFNKLKIPHLIGLILAGAVIGPHGFNLMLRDNSVVLFATVGILYIMFLAGIEIDLGDFKKNKNKSILFGIYTFLIPMILGIYTSIYILNFSLVTSVLLAIMYATHTLITYPIVSKLGVIKNRAVNITIGGTIFTNVLALLILAVVIRTQTGEMTNLFWFQLIFSIVLFIIIIFIFFPIIGRWFFKKYDDNIAHYIFVLGMVYLAAFLAQLAGIEPIIGAFLAGLALNRLIPQTSPLMNRIEFVGNALFIPFFLIGVGMLVDFNSLIKDYETIKVALTMTIVATIGKYLPAYFAQKSFKFTTDERNLIFGLSNSQAAGTLATVLIGYQIIIGQTPDGENIRLLNESVLNGTILMILVTCTIASFVTQKSAQNIALNSDEISFSEPNRHTEEKILIPLSNPETISELMNLSMTIKTKQNKNNLYALSIVNNNTISEDEEKKARELLNKATVFASSADLYLNELIRYDLNLVNGITGVVREYKISDIILGLHNKKGFSDTFLGNLTEGILKKCNTSTLIYKSYQPISTLKRHLVIIPKNAEKELGFVMWLNKIINIGKNTGNKIVFYASKNTIKCIQEFIANKITLVEYNNFKNWGNFLLISREVKPDDNLIIIMSRQDRPSYAPVMEKIPSYLNKYSKHNNFILIYPKQTDVVGDNIMDIKKWI